MKPSLYIHIPFCHSKCPYCDFYSIPHERALAERLVDTLCGQIQQLDNDFVSIYIGGGTPTVLDIRLLRRLLSSLTVFAQKSVEFTVEANPESLNKDKAKLFLESGVNRISIGVQSLYAEKLKKLNRIHSVEQALNSIFLCQRIGFKNISIDLIFGVYGERLADWEKELKVAVTLPINHISAYSLSYEKRTPLYTMMKHKYIKPLADSAVAEMYEYALSFLPPNGFFHYEVSNFAKEGFTCQHNLNYWQNNPYIGLGPSSVSYTDGIRKQNISDTEEYIRRVTKNQSTVAFQERLSAIKRARETAAIKIRTKEGISFRWFKERSGFDFQELQKDAITYLLQNHLLQYRTVNKRRVGVSLTQKGFLFCDTVSSEFL